MEELLQRLLDWTALHPYAFSAAVFLVALMESLVVLGLLIPGAALLFGAGALIATGALPLYPIMLWTVLGAAIGDIVSFLLGWHYHQRLRVLWPFRRYPQLVNRGVDFFVRHGGKSVFMARFIGPLRPVVPAIAGMMNMPVPRFLLIDCIACLLWAPLYILPGIVFGASLGLAAEVAGRLVVLLVLVAGIAWIGVWLAGNLIRLLQPHALGIVEKLLDWSRNHPLIRPLAGSLLDPDHPEARGLTVLSVLFFITLWLLLLIWRQVLHGEFIGGIDAYIFHTFSTLRTPWADTAMLFFTQLGANPVLISVLLVCCGWLLLKGNSKAAVHWLATFICAGLLTWILKVTTQVPRPLAAATGFSFPSAHAGMSVAVYGYLALLIARELPQHQRWLPYLCAGCLVVPIALSRLYLGAHWFSDVLAGLTLGLFWVTLIGIAYDRHPAPRLPVRRVSMLAVLVMALSTSLQFSNTLHDQRYFAGPETVERITLETWRNSNWQRLPGWRIDLEGSHVQPLNLQWAGSLQELQSLLLNQGWQQPVGLTALSALNWLAPEPKISELPVLPEVNDGVHQQLLLVAPHDGQEQRLTVLRLWPSAIEITDQHIPVWLGKVSYQYLEKSMPLIRYLRSADEYDEPLLQLATALHAAPGVRMQWRQREKTEAASDWRGNVLLAWQAQTVSGLYNLSR